MLYVRNASFPAIVLALGCATGFLGQRFVPDDAVRRADEPVAQAAIADTAPPIVDDDAPTTAATRSVPRASDGLFYVHARINGHKVRFLVDTGASVMVLRAEDAALVGASPDRDRFDTRVDTAGGRARMAWTHLGEVSVAGRTMHGVRAAVMRNGLPVSLLGQDMLARLSPVKIDNDRLELAAG